MVNDLQRAFSTMLDMTRPPQVDPDAWEDAPDFFPPIPCPVERADTFLDEAQNHASLIKALEDAQQAGFTQDNTKTLAERLQGTGIRELPSMEAFTAFPNNAVVVSMEAVRESIKQTLRTVLQVLARFWAALMDLVQGWLEMSRIVRTRVVLAQGKLRTVAGMSLKQESVTGSLVPWLSTDVRKADNARAIAINLHVLTEQVKLMRANYLPMVGKICQKLVSEFEQWHDQKEWTSADASSWLEGLNSVAQEFDPARTLHATTPYVDTDAPTYTSAATQSECLPGFRWVVVLPGPQVDAADSVVGVAGSLQRTCVVLEEVQRRDRTAPESIPTFAQRGIEQILDQTLDLAKEIEATVHSDLRRTLREMTLRLERLANSNVDVPDGTVGFFHSGVGYVRVISRWIKYPYQDLILHALNVCNNSVRMCNLHTRAYKDAPKQKENNP